MISAPKARACAVATGSLASLRRWRSKGTRIRSIDPMSYSKAPRGCAQVFQSRGLQPRKAELVWYDTDRWRGENAMTKSPEVQRLPEGVRAITEVVRSTAATRERRGPSESGQGVAVSMVMGHMTGVRIGPTDKEVTVNTMFDQMGPRLHAPIRGRMTRLRHPDGLADSLRDANALL